MENPEIKKQLPIEWYVPENIVSQYANNIVVQHGDNEFIVSFFLTIPPLIIGSPEEIRAQVEKVEEVRSKCVARIIIAPEKMELFIQALTTNYKISLSKKGLEEEK
jgi:hypothetical protein